MKKGLIIVSIVLLSFLPTVLASDRYFYIKSTDSPYEATPGEKIVLNFELVNKQLKAPKNVTAYIDGCPNGWVCEEKLFSYEKEGTHEENLTIRIGKNAIPKKYTMYVKLKSWYPVTRGDDKILITVVNEKDTKVLSYEEYKARETQKEEVEETYIPPKETGSSLVSTKKASEEEMADEEETTKEEVTVEAEPEVVEEKEKSDTIEEVKDDVVENLERMESDRGFVEYATVVLLILLIVVGIGAILAFMRKEE